MGIDDLEGKLPAHAPEHRQEAREEPERGKAAAQRRIEPAGMPDGGLHIVPPQRATALADPKVAPARISVLRDRERRHDPDFSETRHMLQTPLHEYALRRS